MKDAHYFVTFYGLAVFGGVPPRLRAVSEPPAVAAPMPVRQAPNTPKDDRPYWRRLERKRWGKNKS